MLETIQNLGIPAVVALLLLREIRAILKDLKDKETKKPNGAGEQPIEFWVQRNKQIMKEELAPVVKDVASILERVDEIKTTTLESNLILKTK